jgi:hypothetical protein
MNANRGKNKDLSSSGKSNREGATISTTGDLTNAGDTDRDLTDTADIARASISKGMESQENVNAIDIAKGTAENDGVIQGVAQTIEERGITEETNRKTSNTKDVSTIVNSGTSLTESETIDRADIHSDDGARHIEKAQEKLTERVVDKETGSWKIKEKDDEEQ